MIYSTPSNINVYFSTLCEGTSASIVFLKEPRCPGGSPRARGASCRTVLKPQKGGRTMLFSFIMLYWLKVCGHILVAGEGGRRKTPQRYTECTLLACRQCRASTHNTKKHPNRFRIRPEWGASGSRATVLYSRFNFRVWKKISLSLPHDRRCESIPRHPHTDAELRRTTKREEVAQWCTFPIELT